MRHSNPIKAILERELKRLEGKRMDGPACVVGEIARLHSAVEALESIALNRNPADTDALHQKRVHDAGQRLANSSKAIRSRANEILNANAARLREELLSRTGLRPPETLEGIMRQQEFRAVVRGLDDPARNAIMTDAIKAKDAEVLGALFNAPALVTGINDKFLCDMRAAYEKSVAPDTVAELAALLEADQALQVVVRSAETAATEAQDEKAMVAFVKAEEAARAAQESFGEAMQ